MTACSRPIRSEGSKTYVEADITIDGTKIESVGLRLKGNSTLRSLLGRGGSAVGQVPPQPGGQGPPQLGGQGPPGSGPGGLGGGSRPIGAAPQPPPGGAIPGGIVGGGTTPAVTTDQPEKLPWLIQFDEFVKNRRYQGQKEIAVRPSAGVTPTTALNEVLSLKLIAMAGEPSERLAYSSFSVNGSKPALRLVLEQPGDEFAGDNFEDDGVLYKSLSTGRFQYLGEDPLAYSNAYRQITQKNSHDLAPVIKLLKWVTDASDAEFDADLDKHVDATSLARYIALHNLLLDSDDMSGPGQNSYLWYDLDTKRFTVISWDVNLSLSGTLTQGPLETGGLGGGALLRGGRRDDTGWRGCGSRSRRPPVEDPVPRVGEVPAGLLAGVSQDLQRPVRRWSRTWRAGRRREVPHEQDHVIRRRRHGHRRRAKDAPDTGRPHRRPQGQDLAIDQLGPADHYRLANVAVRSRWG